ncbi:PleD family two-component system response regulator [Dyadobacter sp. CY343]|uniref:response regulator n=1 Tax=Dyadobacter sp. CY343 TaxID=2907299 RepID=UPI0038D517BD
MIEAIKAIDPSIEIMESENGQELLTVLQSQTVLDRCLIILDMNMPKMNGLETLSNLRIIPRLASLPIVMLSTSGNPDVIDFARKLGALDYYIKPRIDGKPCWATGERTAQLLAKRWPAQSRNWKGSPFWTSSMTPTRRELQGNFL